MAVDDAHLTRDQVARIAQMLQETDAIIIGGQSVNLWAEHYASGDNSLARQGPFTSKDIDFYGNTADAQKLADSLYGGRLYLPSLDDNTPSAAKVVGVLDDRKIEIDFMRVVLGVRDSSIKNKFVTLYGRLPTGEMIRLMLLHPLDCVQSRFANINVLHREDDLSLRQAAVAIDVLRCFIDDLIELGEWRHAQRILHDLYDVIRRDFIRKAVAGHYPQIDPLTAMKSFSDHQKLDPRWRSLSLGPMVERLEAMIARMPGRAAAAI